MNSDVISNDRYLSSLFCNSVHTVGVDTICTCVRLLSDCTQWAVESIRDELLQHDPCRATQVSAHTGQPRSIIMTYDLCKSVLTA